MMLWDDVIVQWSFDKGLFVGVGIDMLFGVLYQILLLKSGEKIYGLVVVELGNLCQLMILEQQCLLEMFMLLVVNVFEWLMLIVSEEQVWMVSECEQICNVLLVVFLYDLCMLFMVLFGQVEILMFDLVSEGLFYVCQVSEICQYVLNII